ncbi:MAG TPA: hypothetical protein DGH68_02520 [Bacteroidetes bacterium]|nr:hypothetical protein [Bacteroidota bacterium]
MVPIIKVKDMQKSLDFYTKILGFQTTEQHTLENGEIVRASVGVDSTLIVLSLMKDVQTSQRIEDVGKCKLGVGVEFCFNIKKSQRVYDLFAEIETKGILTIKGPQPELWSNRLFTVTDPDGYVVSFAQHVDTAAPQRTRLKTVRFHRTTRRMPYASIFGTR